MLKFDLPKNESNIIKVLGVGGGGSNAVNHMFNQGIKGVDFIVCNTDAQALNQSPVPVKIQLGSSLTEGRGAGSVPAVGKSCAEENIEDLKDLLAKETKMLFITAGMGGGTGTGAAPVIAQIAREMNVLTVAIVTIPFSFEGRKRRQQAEEGIRELRQYVDTLLVICNDKIRELYGNLSMSDAFSNADNILSTAAKGIAEIITIPAYVNVDFEDVKTVMKDSGGAIMGTGVAEGENRAVEAIQMALASPLLNNSSILGASDILLYMASGNQELTMDEVTEITNYIQDETGSTADVIWGAGTDDVLEDKISVTIIATGFETDMSNNGISFVSRKEPKKTFHDLGDSDAGQEKMKIDESVPPELDIQLKTDETPAFDGKPEESSQTVEAEKTPEATEEIRLHLDDVPPAADEPVETIKPGSILKGGQDSPTIEAKVLTKDSPVVEPESQPDPSEQINKSADRIRRLREFSVKLKTGEGLAEMEKEPAYKRKQITLNEVKPADESDISRYSLNEDAEKGEIKSSNPFLEKNVD